MALPDGTARDHGAPRSAAHRGRPAYTEIRDRLGSKYEFLWTPAPGGAARLRFLSPDDARRFLGRFELDSWTLGAFHRILRDSSLAWSYLDPDGIVQRVAEALARGDLEVGLAPLTRMDRDSRRTGGPERATGETPVSTTEEPGPPRPSAPVLTWIEVELVGEDDVPIAGERYRLTLSSGRVLEGTLDAAGTVRFEQMTPGTFDLTFPRLDREAWSRA